MRNKKLIITFAVALMSFLMIAAFASGFIELSSDTDVSESDIGSDADIIAVSSENISSDNISAGIKSHQAYALNFDMENLTYEQYLSAESYLNFIAKHSLSEQELSRIDSLVKNGTTVDTIADIYKFYLTTNEDFEIISQIAELEEEIWGKNWIENAFNKITQNKHGVIKASEASEYLENFETSEILYANILCRKGVYTIQEILEMHNSGTSWNEITDSVYSSVISSQELKGSQAERNNMFMYLNSGNFIYDDSPYEIYELADRCARYKVNLGDTIVDGENLEELKKKITDEIDNTYIPTVNKLKEAVGLPEEYMTREEYSQYYKENHSRALDSGMTEKEIELLERKGYSMKEIADGSEICIGDISSIVRNVKTQRGAEIK